MKKLVTLLMVLVFGLLMGCSTDSTQSSGGVDVNHGTNNNNNNSSSNILTISPVAGDYSDSFIEVSLSAESGAEIYYTTDGTAPTEQSNRYTGPFKIIGSKTVRALYVSNGKISAISNAIYNLNVGKSSTQLGSIKGTVGLSNKISASMISQLSVTESHNDVDVYITSPEMPGVVQKTQVGKSFRIDGMDSNKIYPLYFTNIEPGPIISSSRGDNTKPVVALKIEVQPEEGDGVDVGEVELKPTGTITGTAKKYADDGTEETDHTGITVFIPGTSFSAYTDKNGSFSMTGVPQGLHVIRAMFAGYTFSEKENIMLSSDDDSEPRTVIADPFELYYAKGTLKGSVILSDSENGNSGVDIVISEATGKYSSTAVTQANGGWLINDVTPGTYSIEIHKDGYVDQTINDIIVTGAKITTVPRVVLQEDGGSVTGSVTVSAVTDLAGISILAERQANGNVSAKTYYALTNANGEFTFESLAVGTYTITATYPGYRSAVRENVIVTLGQSSSAGIMNINEKATYSVTGSCVLAGQNSGFEGTNVLMQSSNGTTRSTTTNIDGGWTISDVDVGSYIFTFSRTGFVTNNTVTAEVGTRVITVVDTVVLQSNVGTVSGNVTLESADTNEGIAILIYKEDNHEESYNTVTDSRGHYAIAGITPGYYRVQATKNGYNTGTSDPITVSSGMTTTPSDMQLSISLRSLYGTVTLEGRTDYTGVRITATKTTSTAEIYSALSNRDGFYALSGMTPGEYILSLSFEGYRSYTSPSISLSADSSLNLDTVELNKATGHISGIVNLEGCTDHSGITVSIVGTDYTAVTAANGAYQFTVPSGNYPGGVRFEKADYQLTAKAETITVLTDSTFGVTTAEMKATANTLKGIITLAGATNYSGIIVTVDGINGISCTSAANGAWQLDHVPLGERIVRFTKTNVPDATKQIEVVPSDYIDVGTLEMMPDSATLKGYVYLDGMTDHSNITVTVTTTDKDDIVVKTAGDGSFEANNILASGSHTVTFSRLGWVSQNLVIDDFVPLETRIIGDNREYVLLDTTAPTWGSSPIVINNGANFTREKNLHIELSPIENGSGVDKMSVQLTRTTDGVPSSLYPSVHNWQNYKIGFDFDISTLPEQYVGNGLYTVFITLRDKSGNVSETRSQTITLTNMVTPLSGPLKGDKLHLTEANSPYIVESSCVVEAGDTLIIDPGVEVQFALSVYEFTENYYTYYTNMIRVYGTIVARGTADKKILFTKTNDNQGVFGTTQKLNLERLELYPNIYSSFYAGDTIYWDGIIIDGGNVTMNNTYQYVEGNIFEYCEFEYANRPLTIKTAVYLYKCIFQENNTTFVNVLYKDGYKNIMFDNVFKSGINLCRCEFANNQVSRGFSQESKSFKTTNNTFTDTFVVVNSGDNSGIQNNIFENCTIHCNANYSNLLIVSNNNFVDCRSPIVSIVEARYVSGESYNFTHNYWGAAQTEELDAKGTEANISFINDFYDNVAIAKVNYSNWATSPIVGAGYQGDNFDYSSLGD